MTRLVLRRLLALVPLLAIVSIVVFGLVELAPGDPAAAFLGETATAEQIEAVRASLGLDDPWAVRYGRWVAGVATGDFGTSIFSSYSVSDAIATRLPVTLSLIVLSLTISLAVGLPVGIFAGTRPGTLADKLTMAFTAIGVAMPSFWLALLLVLFVALRAGLVPATGYVPLDADPAAWLRHLILPSVTLGVVGAAEIARQARAGIVDVLELDYVRTARAKGLLGWQVIGKHALRNALIPVVTVTGLQVARLFSIAAIIEQIFNLPGLGQLAVSSAFQRDVPMVQGIVLVVTGFVLATNFVVDLSYGWLNPKVRGA